MKLRTLLAAGLVCIAARAAEPRRIYLANDDHTDFMWTADADTYGNVFVEMLDWHLKLADETATNAPPYRNRFNADGNYGCGTTSRRSRRRSSRGSWRGSRTARSARR